MLQLRHTYPDADVKKSALTVAKRHLWYLSEINVGLFFLSRIVLIFDGKNLSHFITNKTKKFGIHDITAFCSDSLETHVNALVESRGALQKS